MSTLLHLSPEGVVTSSWLRKLGKKGYPKFQKDNRSVEYKTSGWSLHPTKRRITITDKKGIGELKLLGKWHIHAYPIKAIKRVRLVRRADGYYCQFCVDVECVDIQPKTGQEIGVDVGLESFYTDSNGHHEPNPKFLRKGELAIKHAQRQAKSTVGQTESNALGVAASTLVGAILLGQAATLSKESPCL